MIDSSDAMRTAKSRTPQSPSARSPFYMNEGIETTYNTRAYNGLLHNPHYHGKFFQSTQESVKWPIAASQSFRQSTSPLTQHTSALNNSKPSTSNTVLQKLASRISEEYRKKQIQQQQQTPLSLLQYHHLLQPQVSRNTVKSVSKSSQQHPIISSTLISKQSKTDNSFASPVITPGLGHFSEVIQSRKPLVKKQTAAIRLESLVGREKRSTSLALMSSNVSTIVQSPPQQIVKIKKNMAVVATVQQQQQQHQPPPLFPLTKIFLLNRINNIQDMKKQFLNFDLQPFLLANFKKQVHQCIDVETITRLQPHIIRVMNDPTLENPKDIGLSPHLVLPQSKSDLLRLVGDFEANTVTEKRFFEVISHLFVPSQKYREQIVSDLIESINQKGEHTKDFFTRVEMLFDVNGNLVQDVLSLPYPTLLLLAGDSQTGLLKNSLLREFEEFVEQERRQLQQPVSVQESIHERQQVAKSAVVGKRSTVTTSLVNQSNNNNNNLNKSQQHTQQQSQQYQRLNSIESPRNVIRKGAANPFDSGQKDNSMMSSIQYDITNPVISAYGVSSMQSKIKTRIRQHQSLHQQQSASFNLSTSLMSEADLANSRLGEEKRKLAQTHMKPTDNLINMDIIEGVCSKFPTNVNRDDVFRYHAEFQSMKLMNAAYEERNHIAKDSSNTSSNVNDKNYVFALNFFVFCTHFKYAKHQTIIHAILRTLHFDFTVYIFIYRFLFFSNMINLIHARYQQTKFEEIKLSWEQFILLRVLFEQKAEDENVYEFFWRLFDPMRLGTVGRSHFFELLDGSQTLVTDTGVEAKLYPHQMWNYFTRYEFVNEIGELMIAEVLREFHSHKYTIFYLIHWILNNYDESSELEVEQLATS